MSMNAPSSMNWNALNQLYQAKQNYGTQNATSQGTVNNLYNQLGSFGNQFHNMNADQMKQYMGQYQGNNPSITQQMSPTYSQQSGTGTPNTTGTAQSSSSGSQNGYMDLYNQALSNQKQWATSNPTQQNTLATQNQNIYNQLAGQYGLYLSGNMTPDQKAAALAGYQKNQQNAQTPNIQMTQAFGNYSQPSYSNINWNQLAADNQAILNAKTGYANNPTLAAQEANQARQDISNLLAGSGLSASNFTIANTDQDPTGQGQLNNIYNNIATVANYQNNLANSVSQQMAQEAMNTMNPNSIDYQGLWNQSQQIANLQAQQQLAALNAQKNYLTSSQQNAAQAIANQLAGDKSTLEDQSFMNALNAHQSAADRGMSNSPMFMDDQDVRLGLDRQKSLASLESNAANQTDQSNAQFAQQLADVASQQAAVNPTALASQMFMNLYNNAQTNLANNYRIYGTMYSDALKNDAPTADASLANQLNMLKENNNQLNALGLATNPLTGQTGQTMSGLDTLNKILNSGGQYLNPTTGQTGTSEKANMDLATINDWAAKNQLDQEKINNTSQQIANTAAYQTGQLQNDAAKNGMTQNVDQINALGKVLASLGTNIDSMRKNNQAIPSDVTDQYNAIVQAMAKLAGASTSSGPTYGSAGTAVQAK